MNLANFIVAGCSFSVGISDKEVAINCPTTWSHFLLSKLNPKFFYNLAIPGSGNFAIANNLIYLLESKNHIEAKDSLIIFNISGLDRIDTMVPVDHPNANKSFSWDKDFKFGWIVEGGFLNNKNVFKGLLQKNMGFEQVQLLSCLSMVQCFSYLESRNFNYRFMLMDNNILNSPVWFTDFLNVRQDKWIQFDHAQSMHEYAKNTNLLSEDKFHPSIHAHKLIADQIFNKII